MVIIKRIIVALFRSKTLRYGILSIFLGLLAGGGIVFIKLYKIAQTVPSAEEISKYRFNEPSMVYDSSGVVIAELGVERRYPIRIDEMPINLINAVVATEDSRFYEHNGIDMIGIARAFVVNIKARRLAEGGSTLTQQLVKNIFYSPEKKLIRKFKEAVLAYRLEQYLTKDEILEFYLNYVNFGRGGYGVQAAAINYFGKNAKDLSLAECALLAGLPKAPGLYAPHLYPERALSRRNHVLNRMLELGYITEAEYYTTIEEPIVITDSVPLKKRYAGYFLEYVLKFLSEELDITNPQNMGLKVYTTLNIDFQIKAEIAVQEKLMENARRIGYFGVVGKKVDYDDSVNLAEGTDSVHVQPSFAAQMEVPGYLIALNFKKAVVTSISDQSAEIAFLDNTNGILMLKDNKWAKPAYTTRQLTDFKLILSVNDIIYVSPKAGFTPKDGEPMQYLLEQDPPMEASLIAVDPETGAIYAMVGGFAFEKSMFNRAVQAKRQVGSVYKSLIYAIAFEQGYQPMDKILDAPYITQPDAQGMVWRPKNYEDRYYGLTTLKEGLTRSRNIVTIKMAEKLGISKILAYSKKFGITSDLAKDLSITIGSGSISLLEMTYAYSVFPNLGTRPSVPYFVTRVEDADGNVLFDIGSPEHVEVIKPNTAQVMTDILVNVVERGTGFRAKAIQRPVGAKTGTSNDDQDAWFIGFTPNLVVGVWVGFDEFHKGGVGPGSLAAGPIWVTFVNSIIQQIPYALFPVSEGVIYRKVDENTWEAVTGINTDEITFEPYLFDLPVVEESEDSIEIVVN